MLNRRPEICRRLVALAACLPVTFFALNAHAGPTTMPVMDETPEAQAANVAMSKDLFAYQSAIAKPEVWSDPAVRAEAAKTLVPQIHRTMDEGATLARLDPKMAATITGLGKSCSTDLAALGDADALADLQHRQASTDPAVKLMADCDAIRVRWRQASTDATKQSAVADSAFALAKAHPDQDPVYMLLTGLSYHAATPQVKADLSNTAAGMPAPAAVHHREMLAGIASGKLEGHVGHPLALVGTLSDGAKFSTADWKGKVVLVDFWATWCGPCKGELPRVREAYHKYHAQGLEVLGVSNDYSVAELTNYASSHDLPWPQLIDTTAAAGHKWNPLTKEMGIWGIPVMFLIDRNGVCRSVTARNDFEKMIPELLKDNS